MKVVSSERVIGTGDDTQPLGAPDLAKVELFQAALSAPPSNGDGAADPSGDDASGLGQALGGVLREARRGVAAISDEWHQADALASDLGQRSRLDSGFISDLLKLQQKIGPTDIKLYLCTKIAGKCTQTLDTLSRG